MVADLEIRFDDEAHLLLTVAAGDRAIVGHRHHSADIVPDPRPVDGKPDHPDALYYGGIAALYTGEENLAVELLLAATKALPDRADIINNLGAAYRQSGQIERAAEAFRKATELDPKSTDAFYNLGDTLRDCGQTNDAIKAYRQAIEIDPAYIDAYINLGATLAASQQFPEAIEILERAIHTQPEVAETHNTLGKVRQKMGDIPTAQKDFRQAIALRPDYADAYYNLGTTLIFTKDFLTAVEAFGKTIELVPDHAEAHAGQGATLTELKQYTRAIDAFRRTLALRPQHPAALRGLGDAHLAYGDLQEAEAAYRQALSVQDNDIGLMDSLSDTLQKMERFEEAAALYEKILEIDPNNATAAHFAAALQGKTTTTAPVEYVQKLFDDFADRFEETLTNELAYNVPHLIYEMLTRLQADGKITLPFRHALDLGCGTGLCGVMLKKPGHERVAELHGVDVSAKMIAEAETKNLYDSLNIAENVEYLDQSDPEMPFDFIYAADVFVYVGSLEATFAAVHARLTPSGTFIFTVESLDHGTYALNRTGRYAHHDEYIKTLASKIGFIVQECQEIVVRQESDTPIPGLLLALIRS